MVNRFIANLIRSAFSIELIEFIDSHRKCLLAKCSYNIKLVSLFELLKLLKINDGD